MNLDPQKTYSEEILRATVCPLMPGFLSRNETFRSQMRELGWVVDRTFVEDRGLPTSTFNLDR